MGWLLLSSTACRMPPRLEEEVVVAEAPLLTGEGAPPPPLRS